MINLVIEKDDGSNEIELKYNDVSFVIDSERKTVKGLNSFFEQLAFLKINEVSENDILSELNGTHFDDVLSEDQCNDENFLELLKVINTIVENYNNYIRKLIGMNN